MLIFLYLAGLAAAIYWVSKTLIPEMAKPPLPRKLNSVADDALEFIQSDGSDKRLAKLETLLAEKNKNIQLLQMELKIFHVQVRDHDKVKVLLDEEIHRLREQNRMFRSELGLPTAQPKEISIT